jgi:hypothetical protein
MSEKGKIIIEATGFRAPENERFVARVHLGHGPENLRHAYGATVAEAERALKARLAQEAADGKGGESCE